MLTIFSIPKAFEGPMDVIQRNAINSWMSLVPECEVILFGDDAGTERIANELGVRHIAKVNRNEFGTPLLDHIFHLADMEAKYPLLCYVNADIILTSDFLQAVSEVSNDTNWFLMTARRWNLDIIELIDYRSGWEGRLRVSVMEKGKLHHHTGIDFWVYPKGLLKEMPPFAVGRVAYECWCLYTARATNALLVDATEVVMSVHQNHDYSHHPQGELGVGRGIEAQRNREMVGGKPYFFTIRDRTHILTANGLRKPKDIWRLWRGFRSAQVLPFGGPLPIRSTLGLANRVVNICRDLILSVRRVRLVQKCN